MIASGTLQTSRDEIRQEVQTAVRQGVREATNAARNAARDAANAAQSGGPAVAPPPLPPLVDPMVVDALRAQIAAERSSIEALTQQLTNGVTDARERVITDQIEQAQERLTSLQAQLDRALGQTQAITQTGEPSAGFNEEMARTMAQRAENMAYGFFLTVAVIAIGVPLVRAFARWLDRRGHPAPVAPTAHLEPRLDRIEQAIESIAIEVERISEGQRFTNKLMGELKALPAPNPLEQGWPKAAAERQEVRNK